MKKRKKLKKKQQLQKSIFWLGRRRPKFLNMFLNSLDFILSESKIKMAENCFYLRQHSFKNFDFLKFFGYLTILYELMEYFF
jgi:hypothetical protein